MNFLLKLKESVISVLPIAILVLILGLTIGNFPTTVTIKFLIGCLFVIVGMALFSLGADMAMMPIGTLVGSRITKSRKVWLICLISIIIGLIITIAEPDLLVLATRLDSAINKWVLIVVVAVGVGLFLMLAMIRIIFRIPLKWLLVGLYLIAIILAIFVNPQFFPLAFDSGGITTGPMTVPFIMALGLGVFSLDGSGDTDDSFGLVALCSIGPIILVLILGLVSNVEGISITAGEVVDNGKFFLPFLEGIPEQLKNIALAIAPITLFFLVFKVVAAKNLPKSEFLRIIIGIVYTFIGLVVFLAGVEVGFQPAGILLGQSIALYNKWVLIPIGMAVGLMIIAAEPAVHILAKQVQEVSGGTIKKKNMFLSLMIGVSLFVGIAMLRVITGISLWWFIGFGYGICLILTFFVPKTFVAIAFDSGGVASGPMTATFLLPFAMGACEVLGGNILTDAFGLVALVAFAPLPTLEIMGLIAKIKQHKPNKNASTREKVGGIPHENEIAVVDDTNSTQKDLITFSSNAGNIDLTKTTKGKSKQKKKKNKQKDIIDF